MMNTLFEFNGKDITINPMVFSIPEFEKIWNRDKNKDKVKARKELVFVYAMASNNEDNIWRDYIDLKKREEIVIGDLFKNEKWYPDEIVMNAITKFRERYPKSAAEILLDSSKLAMLKIKDYLDNLNLNEVDEAGRLKHNPKIVLDVAKQAVSTYMQISEVIEKIEANKKLDTSKIKGNSEKGYFEDMEE